MMLNIVWCCNCTIIDSLNRTIQLFCVWSGLVKIVSAYAMTDKTYTLSSTNVFVTVKPHPASKPLLIIADDVVGGALANPNGFSKFKPHISILRSTKSTGVKKFGRFGGPSIFSP